MSVVRDASALALGPMIDIGASTTAALNNGFVVIRTRRPAKDELLTRATLEQHDTYALSSQGSLHFGDDKGDGDTGYVSLLGARYQTQGKDDWYNARNATTVMGKAGYVSKHLTVDTLAYHDRGQFQFQRGAVGEATTGTNASPGVAYAKWSYSPLDTTLLSSDASLSWNERNRSLLSVSYTRVTDTDRMDYYPVPPATKSKAGSEFHNEDSTTYVALRHSINFTPATLLQVGANYLHWNTPTGETNFEGYPREETVVGGFALLEQAFADNTLIVDASLRADRKHIDTGWENIANSQGKAVSNTYHDRDLPTAWFFALGGSWRPTPDWLVNARYAHGKQGAAGSLRTLGNKALNGTNQDKFELGAEASLMPAFTPSATWFVYSIRHDKYVAQTNTTVTPYLVYYDETDTRRQGVELVARGTLRTGTSYRLGWMHFLKQYASTNSQLAATSAKNLFDASVQQALGVYTATLSAKRVSTYLSNSFANDGLYHDVGSYTRVDLSVSRDIRLGGSLLKASVYGRNLGNSHYESIFSFPDVGRVIGAEFNVEL